MLILPKLAFMLKDVFVTGVHETMFDQFIKFVY